MVLKRCLDIILAGSALSLFALPMAFVAIAVRLTSSGPAIYWSQRVGKDNLIFWMPKFRTMKIDTPTVATHLLGNAKSHLTPIGGFLRKSSLDELPQLWCILIGQMSFVGPRPALFNQDDLISARSACGVHLLRPGLTGWAQVNGRDDLSVAEKVEFDAHYLQKHSLSFDLWIIVLTVSRVLKAANVKH